MSNLLSSRQEPPSANTRTRFGSSATAEDENDTFHHESLNHTHTASTATSNPAAFKHHKVRAAIGLHSRTPVIDEHVDLPHHDLMWPRIRAIMREPFAEFLGVFVMICFGNGSVAQVLLSGGQTSAPGMDGFGNYQSISWG